MVNNKQDNIKTFPFWKFEGKAVLILCKNDYKYNTSCLEVFNDSVGFTDKFGRYVVLSFEEILSIKERDSNA
jgi:hypothetical protein